MERRDFLKTATVAASAVATDQLFASLLSAEEKAPAANGMIYRTLGRTGERVSAIGLGGYHIGQPGLQEQESIQLIRQAIDRGITFMDNCWDYNDGVSEVRMGKALADGYRSKVFLMTKIDGRTKAEAAQQIDESLQRLQTDHVDLMQFHEVIRLEDPDRIFAEGGAMEAMLEAKKAGKVRYIGFTGHKDPLGSSADAGCGRAREVPLRRRADAAERDGCALPQLRAQRAAGAGARRHRAAGHEGVRRSLHSRQQDGEADRVPALLPESADRRADYRH